MRSAADAVIVSAPLTFLIQSPASVSLHTTRRQRTAIAVVAALLSLAVSVAFVLLRPDLTRGAAFLFGDEAANLFAADALHRGRTLYTDVAYPYGPLPIEMYRATSAVAGNSPGVFLALMAVLSASSAFMAGSLIRRSADVVTSAALVLVALLPTMPLPGAPIGGYTSSIYMPVERIVLLAAAMLWSPPTTRSWRRGLCLGVILGACQGVRFGSGAVMVAATAIVDQLAVHGTVPDRRRAARRATAWILAGFLAAETGWAVWAIVTRPRPYALEFLWPLQMWETHQMSGMPRWPSWGGWRMALVQYTMPAIALTLSGAGVVNWIRAGRDRASGKAEMHGGAAMLFVFFVVAALVYFRHEHHFRQFAWMLVPAAAGPMCRVRRPVRLVLLALCAPALWPIASGLMGPPSRDIVTLQTPRGFSLVVPVETAARVEFLNAHRTTGPVLFIPNGAGWLYAYDVDSVSRHHWFYSRAVVRPFEEDTFARDVEHAAIVIRCDPPDRPWPVPDSARALIERTFTVTTAGYGCAIRTAERRAHQ